MRVGKVRRYKSLIPAHGTDLPIFTTANREQRVGSWRTFSKDSKKKKKQKVNILG